MTKNCYDLLNCIKALSNEERRNISVYLFENNIQQFQTLEINDSESLKSFLTLESRTTVNVISYPSYGGIIPHSENFVNMNALFTSDNIIPITVPEGTVYGSWTDTLKIDPEFDPTKKMIFFRIRSTTSSLFNTKVIALIIYVPDEVEVERYLKRQAAIERKKERKNNQKNKIKNFFHRK